MLMALEPSTEVKVASYAAGKLSPALYLVFQSNTHAAQSALNAALSDLTSTLRPSVPVIFDCECAIPLGLLGVVGLFNVDCVA